ncbi:PREDICTED: major histocompatibility complex class I-related gene protein-like, partial [Gekko japonicus]|uniref:Major histocompatibility complex class I-related gene protein-like n=1 Tax=Gekko japonicus TaxID=146911 RepID=A0ABM1L415_GEKJA
MKMGLLWGLVAAAFLLGGSPGSSWHSLRYFYTMIWAPDQGEPDFIAVGYLDDQLGGQYNSTTRRAVPRVPWVRKVEKDDPHFWDWNTDRAIYFEWRMKTYLRKLRSIYNHSRGLHIWQHMFGCELNKDGSKKGFMQYGYNGEDYINFDKETLTWTAAVVPAQVTKRQWDADLADCHRFKAYLEGECIGWLQKFLEYGKESLLRR